MKREILIDHHDFGSIAVYSHPHDGNVSLLFDTSQGRVADFSLTISAVEARKLGRALLMASAGDSFAGGLDLDHGDELGPDVAGPSE